MAKEVTVVSMSWCFGAAGLLKPTVKALNAAQFLDQAPISKSKLRLLDTVAEGVADRTRGEVHEATKRVGNHFTRYLNPAVMRQVRNLPPKKNSLVMLTSAPDFIAKQLMHRVFQASDIRFSEYVASEFEVQDGRYTGVYRPLGKLEDVDMLLAGRGIPEAKTAIINGKDDAEWANILSNTVVMSPATAELRAELRELRGL